MTFTQSRTLQSSIKRFPVAGYVAGLLIGCSGGDADNGTTQQPPLRPGVEDSSKAFKGIPSKAETDFWQSVRNGDDGARAEATAQLKADVSKDPTNGYSAFLAGASAFMPNSGVLRALV